MIQHKTYSIHTLAALAILLSSLFLNSCYYLYDTKDGQPVDYVIAVHGGAGFMGSDMPADKQKAYHDALNAALAEGENVLKEGGAAVEAVEAAIRYMEDSPLFNAGKGAVFNAEGVNELDASIMEGKYHGAGSVAGVRTVRNPITAARMVMTETPHVMLAGEGAEAFALEMGLEVTDSSYFRTDESWERYLQDKADFDAKQNKHGTVGAVARDKNGNLAAGTSTGGMSMKKYGRVGDSPVIGAGTWADNATCAISCTGHGEFFIRYGAAHEVSARMEHRKWTMERSADHMINELFKNIDASGGLIGVDMYGNVVMPFNTTAMFRGYIKEGETAKTYIFK